MIRLLIALLALPLAAIAADDARVSFLEQEVRNVQRQLQTLSRQMDEMRNTPSRMAPRAVTAAGTAPVAAAPQWVDAAKWRAVRTGMSELDVIGALGPPTSLRAESGDRVLLYAMEIGAGAFLGGSVKLRNRAVVEVRQPVLQ